MFALGKPNDLPCYSPMQQGVVDPTDPEANARLSLDVEYREELLIGIEGTYLLYGYAFPHCTSPH